MRAGDMGGLSALAVLFLTFSVAAMSPVEALRGLAGNRKLLQADDGGYTSNGVLPGTSATTDSQASGAGALADAAADAEWTHTYSVAESGSVASTDNSLAEGTATADAVGKDAYTVTHTATAAEDNFAGSVSTSFTTFDPSYQNVANIQPEDDDEGAPVIPLPTDGALAVASATAYGEDPLAQTSAATTGHLPPGSSDPTYTADANAAAEGSVVDVQTLTNVG